MLDEEQFNVPIIPQVFLVMLKQSAIISQVLHLPLLDGFEFQQLVVALVSATRRLHNSVYKRHRTKSSKPHQDQFALNKCERSE